VREVAGNPTVPDTFTLHTVIDCGFGSGAPSGSVDLRFDSLDRRNRRLDVTVREQPARAFRHVAPDRQDHQSEQRAEPERQTPSNRDGKTAVGSSTMRVTPRAQGHTPPSSCRLTARATAPRRRAASSRRSRS